MRTAFIVIHGIGEQNPFETIDPFVQQLAAQFTEHDRPVMLSHEIVPRKNGTDGWNESFVRISEINDAASVVDIHEYFWANLTEKKISSAEVISWVARALKATKNFANQNAEFEKRFENSSAYAWRMRSIYWWVLFLVYAIRIVRFLFPAWMTWFKPLRGWVESWGTTIIVGYIGDIAIYTTTDEKSEYYRVRQHILSGSQSMLRAVLEGEYDKVIVAGHSLGSVIAHDTLNRVNILANVTRDIPIAKLAGLITFGSPLDKIAFFFREHTGENEIVRRQILQHLHSFKAKRWDRADGALPVSSPLQPLLDRIPWVNYYDHNDPVSGHLDYYAVDSNTELFMRAKWGVAHTAYWQHEKMFDDIWQRFLA